MTAIERLTELRAAAKDAKAAHNEAREAQHQAHRALAETREALAAAYAARNEEAIKLALRAHKRAQAAAGDSTLSARIEGVARAERKANADVANFISENLTAVVEEFRPRADAAVVEIKERIAALGEAINEWVTVDQEICAVTRGIAWFDPRRRMPADPFDQLRTALSRIGDVPAPMPTSTLDPAAEAERVEAAIEARRAENAAAWRPFRQAA